MSNLRESLKKAFKIGWGLIFIVALIICLVIALPILVILLLAWIGKVAG